MNTYPAMPVWWKSSVQFVQSRGWLPLKEAEAGVTVYNSWDVDMEREKMKDANIKIYQALATGL